MENELCSMRHAMREVRKSSAVQEEEGGKDQYIALGKRPPPKPK